MIRTAKYRMRGFCRPVGAYPMGETCHPGLHPLRGFRRRAMSLCPVGAYWKTAVVPFSHEWTIDYSQGTHPLVNGSYQNSSPNAATGTDYPNIRGFCPTQGGRLTDYDTTVFFDIFCVLNLTFADLML